VAIEDPPYRCFPLPDAVFMYLPAFHNIHSHEPGVLIDRDSAYPMPPVEWVKKKNRSAVNGKESLVVGSPAGVHRMLSTWCLPQFQDLAGLGWGKHKIG